MLLFDTAFQPAQAQKKPLTAEELKLELPIFRDWAIKCGYGKLPLADRGQILKFYEGLLTKPEFAMSVSEARYWVATFMDREPSSLFLSFLSPKPSVIEHYKLSASDMEAMVRFALAAYKDYPAISLAIKEFDRDNGGTNTGIMRALAGWMNQALNHEEKVASSQNMFNLLACAENTLGDRTGPLWGKMFRTPPASPIPPLA